MTEKQKLARNYTNNTRVTEILENQPFNFEKWSKGKRKKKKTAEKKKKELPK